MFMIVCIDDRSDADLEEIDAVAPISIDATSPKPSDTDTFQPFIASTSFSATSSNLSTSPSPELMPLSPIPMYFSRLSLSTNAPPPPAVDEEDVPPPPPPVDPPSPLLMALPTISEHTVVPSLSSTTASTSSGSDSRLFHSRPTIDASSSSSTTTTTTAATSTSNRPTISFNRSVSMPVTAHRQTFSTIPTSTNHDSIPSVSRSVSVLPSSTITTTSIISTLIAHLSKIGLDWNFTSSTSPNLIFTVAGISGLPVQADKCLFNIVLENSLEEHTMQDTNTIPMNGETIRKSRIELLEKELVVKTILLADVRIDTHN